MSVLQNRPTYSLTVPKISQTTPRIIHARIDQQTEKLLGDLERRLGWNDSKIVRERIRALKVLLVPKRLRKIVGLGQFRSKVPDIA